MADWNLNSAIAHLNSNSGDTSTGHCAKFVRLAINAGGGVPVQGTLHARDFGPQLEAAGFHTMGAAVNPERGDVAVIQPAPGHPDGHVAMYNGNMWVSDFKQPGGLYPAQAYRTSQPPIAYYRRPQPPQAQAQPQTQPQP